MSTVLESDPASAAARVSSHAGVGVRMPAPARPRRRHPVLGAPIDVINEREAIEQIAAWAELRESRAISICNAHSAVTASRDPEFMNVLERSDMVTADGMPLVWMLRQQGHRRQERVDGPDLMWEACSEAQSRGLRVFLYGSTPDTLEALGRHLQRSFPDLMLVGAVSPPFRALNDAEDEAMVRRIEESGAQILFVGLGCPRQEAWMLAHRGRINAVMIGVGAAFDFHAGTLSRAPNWMRSSGLEWLYRLGCEPRRLWKRYLITNSLFVWGALRQIVASSGASGQARR
jgi:N-acetylglucosaminyldiphosphoundecaprenol N-acetyl-beta-D-mannosaminyltransferase